MFRNKRIRLIAAILLIAAASFIGADYFSFFGYREVPEYILQEIKLRLSDKTDNAPVVGAKAKCFQKGNANACSQRDSGRIGLVSVMVPTIRISTKTLLFERGYRYLNSKDPNIQVMLIHADYVNQVMSIDINNHIKNPDTVYQVIMQGRGIEIADEE